MVKEPSPSEASELERTVGIGGALTIGVGTMIGAGIFIFPGLAVARAGQAASISFAIGAAVALLVALPTAELATAMPKSGGGYYFVSRGLGTLPGTIVGVGLTLGLVFASAFYLVGFGEYALAIVVESSVYTPGSFGIDYLSSPVLLASGAGIVLTGLAILGTENTAALQNGVVGVLLAILAVFLSVSLLDILGIRGTASPAVQFMPRGFAPVLTTAALVFTSYLGFGQIATVAKDVVEPQRNLPISIIGSVLLVGVLYVVTVFVAGSAFEPDVIRTFEETAIVEVARVYLGAVGAIGILVAGLLATLSSANASILSASRALYALSADNLAPPKAARLNRRYNTPHLALSFVGGIAVVLSFTGRTETLAEVASFLHLIMYGSICASTIALHRTAPPWYDPSFVSPGYPFVPALGALTSFGLIYFMQPLSQLLGVVIAVFAIGWYFLYVDDVALKGIHE